ncbi:hypothetical protein QE152_g15591 [Popillia japonica]|uniref:Uncharacterized protein n=1 Tax=Popillia japonica TaxID=7064 RepID=A0AAW1L7W3_POPJA
MPAQEDAMIYKAMIRSKMDFGFILYLQNVKKDLCTLNGIRSFSNNPIMIQEGETPVHVRPKYLVSKFVLKSLAKERCVVGESLQKSPSKNA